MAMKKCKECGKDVSSKATACPNCGAVLKETGCLTYIVLFFAIFIVLGIIGGALSGNSSSKHPSSNTSITTSQPKTIDEKAFSCIWNNNGQNNKKIKSGMTYQEVS